MKHFKISVCLLLLLCLLLSACGTPAGESSAVDSGESTQASDAPSGESSAVSAEESDPGAENKTRFEQLNSLVDFDYARGEHKGNVVQGKTYNVSRQGHADYPDNTKKPKLTDGSSPKSFDKETWVGFYSTAREQLEVEFDLGKTVDNICDFSADVLNLTSYGISICSDVAVFVAGEDGEYVEVGRTYTPADISENEAYEYRINLQGAVSARHIKFVFGANNSVWLFIGEISVYAYGDEYADAVSGSFTDPAAYYGYDSVPAVDTPTYYAPSENGYNEVTNLVSGTKPMIFAGESIQNDIATEWYNTKDTASLTDGKKATQTSYSDSRWFHITRGDSREIVFDLGNTCAVNGFKATFLKDTGSGVYPPRFLRLSVSENGSDWQTVYALQAVTATAENALADVDESFGKFHKARYVKISFFVDTHVYVDEIEISGRKNAEGALDVTPDSPTDKDSLAGSYIMPEDFDGVHNIMLSYHCYDYNAAGTHDEAGLVTAEEYLPYVAYLDKEGNISDTLFDAFLFLPYTRFNYSTAARNASGWRYYVDDIYHPDRNMAALDACVGNVKNTLGKGDYKVSVYTPVLYTFQTDAEGKPNKFGDLDGDGVDEDITQLETRKKLIKWIMDEEYNRFRAGGYNNLQFRGFYWFEEAITYSDPHEPALIKYAADYAHSLGVKLFWIPYQLAAGYADWKALGFDMACMQPNYMFHSDFTSDVLYSTAEKTRLLGMCVEMELTGVANRSNAAKFQEYMIVGALTGYMNSIKVYYQDGVPGAFSEACYSDDEFTRKVYDDLYLFAKEKLEAVTPAEITIPDGGMKLECAPGKTVSGKIELGEFSAFADSLAISKSPRYGSLMLNLDGSFVYYAPEGFTGSDSFAVCINLGYVTGGDTVVEIEIGE